MSVLIQKTKDRQTELPYSLDVTLRSLTPKFTRLGIDEIVEEDIEQLLKDVTLEQDAISVVGNKLDINPELLADNESREFKIKGKKYLVRKIDENRIELYRIK